MAPKAKSAARAVAPPGTSQYMLVFGSLEIREYAGVQCLCLSHGPQTHTWKWSFEQTVLHETTNVECVMPLIVKAFLTPHHGVDLSGTSHPGIIYIMPPRGPGATRDTNAMDEPLITQNLNFLQWGGGLPIGLAESDPIFIVPFEFFVALCDSLV